MNTPEFLGLRERTIMPPLDGWEAQTYYVVAVAFNSNNIIHKAIFYTGFLHEGNPAGYNNFGVFNRDDSLFDISDAYYLRAIRVIDMGDAQ